MMQSPHWIFMLSDFHSEWISWREVLKLRKWTTLFLSGLLVVMVGVFLSLIWEYQLLSGQISRLTTQVEVIAEVDSALVVDQVKLIQDEIENFPMVTRVDFWSAERSAQYINDTILSGYLDFLKKTELQVPVNPLFRIQLTDLDQKQALEDVLADKYGDKLLLLDAGTTADRESFANQFVKSVTGSVWTIQLLMLIQLVLVLCLGGYLTNVLLSERRQGFHLAQFLHLSPAYLFLPAWLMSSGWSFLLISLGLILAALMIGKWLFWLGLVLWGMFIIVNGIVCGLGRR
jgi:cell division protein FtsX